jgi:hypothetical protein
MNFENSRQYKETSFIPGSEMRKPCPPELQAFRKSGRIVTELNEDPGWRIFHSMPEEESLFFCEQGSENR